MSQFKKATTWILYSICLFALEVSAQDISPDSFYFAQTKIATDISARYNLKKIDDSLLRQKLMDSALVIYENLDRKYFFQHLNIDEYLDLSYRTQNSKGFISAYRRKTLSSAYDFKKIMSAFKGREVVANKEFANALEQMERESDSLVKVAKMKLNWDDILLIFSMWTSDLEIRATVPDFLFKDSIGLPPYYANRRRSIDLSLGKLAGFEKIDSVHISTLYTYIRENGFPGQRRAGMYSAFMWPLLRHGLGLLMREDTSVSQSFLEKYKYLIPIAYEYAQKGEYTRVRYNYVYQDLLRISKEYLGEETYNYFKKYTLTGNDF